MNNEKAENDLINDLVRDAIDGDNFALEKILNEINDFIFNLSLRMLGTVADAEDARQDILVKIITNLSSFKGKSNFKTWVYRVATNYLIDYKKSMFAKYPLDFEYYENDIQATVDNLEIDYIREEELARELKLSCTNVMLQCLSPINRCVFILGTMFKMNSQLASEILEISPENYRQRLSRSRKKMKLFLGKNCEWSGTGVCKCEKRVDYAIEHKRIEKENLQFQKLKELEYSLLDEYFESMDKLDEQIPVFEKLPQYQSDLDIKNFLIDLIESKHFKKILTFTMEEYNDWNKKNIKFSNWFR